MTLSSLETAITEAERFLKRARECERAIGENIAEHIATWSANAELSHFISPALTAAVKRTSMDLKRALVKVRRS